MTRYIPGVTAHARERVADRFGRDLTPDEWRAVVLDIIDGRSTLLMRQGDGSEAHLIVVGSIALKVVWSSACAVIVTVLPDRSALSPAAETMRRAPIPRASTSGGHYSRGKFRFARTRWDEQP